jgi:hypothetical protein
MKKYTQLLIITCLSIVCNTVSAQDMSGEWNGMLQQSEGGTASAYYFTLNLIQKGNVITGVSKVAFADKPSYFAVMELQGTFENDILTISETKIKSEKIYEGLEWCLKNAKLRFTIQKDGFCVEGTWSGETPSGTYCVPGSVKMCKIVPMATTEPEKPAKNYSIYDKTIFTRRFIKFRETFPCQFREQPKRIQIG